MGAALSGSVKWLLAVSATVATAFIAYEALTIPFLRGVGLAQADFELFVVLVALGVPALAVLSVLSIVCWRGEANGVSLSAWVLESPVGMLWAGNMAIQAGAWLFVMYIRAYRLHAIRL